MSSAIRPFPSRPEARRVTSKCSVTYCESIVPHNDRRCYHTPQNTVLARNGAPSGLTGAVHRYVPTLNLVRSTLIPLQLVCTPSAQPTSLLTLNSSNHHIHLIHSLQSPFPIRRPQCWHREIGRQECWIYTLRSRFARTFGWMRQSCT